MQIENPFQVLDAKIDHLQASINSLLEQREQVVTPKSSGLITRKELAEQLGVSESSLRRYADMGIIKEIRVGGLVRFRYDEVLTALQNKKASRYGKSSK